MKKMSDEEGKPETPAIGLEDVKNIRNFFKHFNVPGSDELETALKGFESSQTVDNEMLVKVAISKAMVSINHPAFTDKMFEGIYKESEEVAYRAHFDKQLVDTLSDGNVKSQEALELEREKKD